MLTCLSDGLLQQASLYLCDGLPKLHYSRIPRINICVIAYITLLQQASSSLACVDHVHVVEREGCSWEGSLLQQVSQYIPQIVHSCQCH